MENIQTIKVLSDAAATLIENQGGGPVSARVLLQHWDMFLEFLIQNGIVPKSISDIPEGVLRGFSAHCDVAGAPPFHDARFAAGAVRLILHWGRLNTYSLATLSAPRVRHRVAYNGKSARKVRIWPPADRAPQHPDERSAEQSPTTTQERSSRKRKSRRRTAVDPFAP
ncbi:hypothetical protein PTKU64_23380 [Paraburkholderia terrae]|uniref:Integrase n=1 Tax=Paraburkholderia terrae TaxID=311230 RepID=A0ABM7TUP6_9BURK|nr:hypothetical protein [Paraburkholderia terrae]BCZ78663.1 hypothetical protein PTKU64_23380 [Paraburkholderia terrae]